MGFFATSGILNERGFFAEGFDPDALDYINRVETADGERLESRVRTAINQFVLGCKADGIWTSLVTSCIMAGARTVAGAITPLVGNAPTNNNFVIGDYSRTLGLKGNDSNKNLDTGYYNDDAANFPNNDSHISCYISGATTDSNGVFVGTSFGTGNRLSIYNVSISTTNFNNRSNTTRLFSAIAVGFQGSTRNNSANFISRATQAGGLVSETTTTAASSTPASLKIGVFAAYPTTAAAQFSSVRLSFYSIGKSLTLSALDSRVTTLMTTLASVIA